MPVPPFAPPCGIHLAKDDPSYPEVYATLNGEMKLPAIFVLLLPLAALPFVALPFVQAQSPKTNFQPGKWQIDSTVTLTGGKQTHSTMSVCANQTGDLWKHPQPNQPCDAPLVTPIASGYNVKISCAGGAGPVQWKMQSTINETFSSDGASFQSSGTSTSQTVFAGRAPMVMTSQIQSTGKRIGPCTVKS